MIKSTIWYDVGGFVGRLISLLPISWIFMIWLNMDLFYWRFVLAIFLYLRAVIAWTLLYFPVSCWLDISSRTYWNVVGYFLPMLSIQKLVLFLDGKVLLHGLLFVDWEIYDMLWYSQYCVTIAIGVHTGGKLTWTSKVGN